MSLTEERLSITRPTFPPSGPRPWPFPEPWPGTPPFNPFPSEDRSLTHLPVFWPGMITEELLLRLYAMPDYQAIIKQYAPLLLKQLEKDPEALKALQDLLKRRGISFDETERIGPLLAAAVIGVSFLVGTCTGYQAEKNKEK